MAGLEEDSRKNFHERRKGEDEGGAKENDNKDNTSEGEESEEEAERWELTSPPSKGLSSLWKLRPGGTNRDFAYYVRQGSFYIVVFVTWYLVMYAIYSPKLNAKYADILEKVFNITRS